ncbi:MAG: ABC transporter ATP-binding protein [Microcoleaceae cyanobacterium]
MIEAVALTKKYGDSTAVEGVSFEIASGETFGLIGTSGCGKTTTLKMLNRLIEPTSGYVLMDGEDVRSRPPEKLRQGIGYVIQNSGLFPHYTVAENIAVVPRLLGWKANKIEQRTAELLDLVKLPAEKFAQRYPRELSGGQQQRVGIARALAANPPVILLDEPFGALDQITRRQIQKEFKQLESLLDKTMVLVTHDVFEAVELCDRICVMDQGIAQQIGTPQELVFRPQSEFIREFFNANRFQLELKVITLQELVPWLPMPENLDQPERSYPATSSLLDVLEDVEESSLKQSYIKITDLQTDQTGDSDVITNCSALLTAFYNLKQSLSV